MGYTTNDFHKIPRRMTTSGIKPLPDCAIITYLWLCQMEHEFVSTDLMKHEKNVRDWFYCTDAQLAEKSGKNIKTIQRGKAILVERGYIETWRGGKEFEQLANARYAQGNKYPTCYRILI